MTTHDRQTAEGILFTDQYQLTMAQLYFRMGMHEQPAQFDHFFRKNPDYGKHQAGYCINAGLAWLLDWMREAHFREEDLACLRAQTDSAGNAVFGEDFLSWLRQHGDFSGISIRAIPEGRVVHPNVPLTVVQGPLAMAQILETALLNQLNYQTLIATKAARLKTAARNQLVIDFGMRRAQGKGANAGARAALIGGVDFSSNTGASCVLGYPPKGTHAHSMVQAILALGYSELDAFKAYARVYPNNCILLVDTIDTLHSGVPHAIRVFEELQRKGHTPLGVRLDSGDLAYLSIQTAKRLNEAGFPDVKIVLSNQLDELVIWQILSQIQKEAPNYGLEPDHLIHRLSYGVGTRLITSAGQAALDGVYKLVAVQRDTGWVPAIKLSETPEKVLNPGNKTVWRLYDQRSKASVDLLTLADETPPSKDTLCLHHPTDHTKTRTCDAAHISRIEPLLVNVWRDGQQVYTLPSLEEIRDTRAADLERLDPGVKRFINPHTYHVSLSQHLWEHKQALIDSMTAD
jgi:nicotinate phosphoribosyltransferase